MCHNASWNLPTTKTNKVNIINWNTVSFISDYQYSSGIYIICSIHEEELLRSLLTTPTLGFAITFLTNEKQKNISFGTIAICQKIQSNTLIDLQQLIKEEEEIMDKPKISVIIAAYNSAGYIEESILSVLNQTLTPVYADNAAALLGGLVAGDQYRTATGVRMEVF